MAGDGEVVGDEHDGDAFLDQGGEQLEDARHVLHVEVAGGLVGEDEGGRADDGPGDGHALALAARELRGSVVKPVRHPHALQGDPGGGGVGFGVGVFAVQQRQRDILQDGEARQQVEGLEDEADAVGAVPRPPIGPEARDLLALEDDAAFRRRVHEAEDVHQGRLTRARGTEDRDKLAALKLQVDAGEGVHALVPHLVGLAQSADGDERRHAQRGSEGRTRLTVSPAATPDLTSVQPASLRPSLTTRRFHTSSSPFT